MDYGVLFHSMNVFHVFVCIDVWCLCNFCVWVLYLCVYTCMCSFYFITLNRMVQDCQMGRQVSSWVAQCLLLLTLSHCCYAALSSITHPTAYCNQGYNTQALIKAQVNEINCNLDHCTFSFWADVMENQNAIQPHSQETGYKG